MTYKSIIFGATSAIIILTFLGLTLATMPLHTSQYDLSNQFILNTPFKETRKVLQRNDLSKDVASLSGNEILREEIVYRKVGVEGRLKNWNFREIKIIELKTEGTIVYLQSDINATPDSVNVLITLKQPNTSIGLNQLTQSIRIIPYSESQTLVDHQVLISVTRKCPTRWEHYMDEKVNKSIVENIEIIEYLMKRYTGE